MNDLNIPERGSFKPFTRTLTAPPGWPWVQSRAARLEAQHTSPISSDDVTIVVRRLKLWALGEQGKFVAIYLRGVDLREGLKFDLEIQGQRLVVDMPSPEQKAATSKRRAVSMFAAAICVASLIALATIVEQRRSAEENHIEALENQLTLQTHRLEGIARAKADARALAELGVDNQQPAVALEDLKHLSLTRDPNSRLQAFYWNKGYWAVEVEGDNPPIQNATAALQRSAKPTRKGVWLWVSAQPDGQP